MTIEELKQKSRALPYVPGVYLMKNEQGEVIYVGKAKALRNRVTQYFQDAANHTEKTRAMVSQVDDFEIIVSDSEFEALVLECALIKQHQPRYNVLLKDGKGYPYIHVNINAKYPNFKLASKIDQDGARYFGPFGSRRHSQDIIDALQTALKLPSCRRVFPRDVSKGRPCLNYHLAKCDAYCKIDVSQKQHAEAVGQAVQLLEGKFSEVEANLTKEMNNLAERLEFEKASIIRDRLKAIEHLGKHQKVMTGRRTDVDIVGVYSDEVRIVFSILHYQKGELVDKDTTLLRDQVESERNTIEAFLTQYYTEKRMPPSQILIPMEVEDMSSLARLFSEKVDRRVEIHVPQRGEKLKLLKLAERNAREECIRVTTKEEKRTKSLELLADMLGLEYPPKRIEAYDISNTGSSDIVGSMAVFINGQVHKRLFRHYKLRDMDKANDYAAIEQVLMRRFDKKRQNDSDFGELPDLVLVDGGKEHTRVAQKVMQTLALTIPVFGMVKDNRHKTRGIVNAEGEELGLQTNPTLFAMIGQMQEVTHNAAIEFHRKQRSKSSYGSSLEEIEGIGPTRRKKLLKVFKTMKGIQLASLEELGNVLPSEVAQKLYQQLHKMEE